jgi:serine O-acetyltransferase
MSVLANHVMFFYKICNKLYYQNINQKNIIKKTIINIIIKIFNDYYRIILTVIYGAFIPYHAKLGNNIIFPHNLFGIFISMTAEIGDNCTIFHHVTIGSSKGLAPKIKNNVFIGCNSNIIGNTIIGNNCNIGAGTTIVDTEIPDNSTVVGSKFKILTKNKINEDIK